MKALLTEPEVIVRRGKTVSVILPIKDYEELLERLEDLEDLKWLKDRASKPLHFRPLEEYLTAQKPSRRVSRAH